jgi:hypothetical protein
MGIYIETLFNLGAIIAFGVIPTFVNARSKYKKIIYGFLFGFGSAKISWSFG